ncbi:MAG TPA: twin-arginine translocase TatA/TatE family subunit [Reyranella sp.]|nr:twin-arginine translocase TatA/TatE family subunit [Reyranella sp.]
MGFGSVWHWVIVALVVLVLFGRGRISEMMGDLGKGIKSFKAGMSEEADRPAAPPPAQIAPPPAAPTSAQPTLNGETPVDPGAAPKP